WIPACAGMTTRTRSPRLKPLLHAGRSASGCYPAHRHVPGGPPMTSHGRNALMALLLAATAWPASAGAAEGQQQPVQADATIRSQTHLDEYLRRHAATGEPTPLDAFSAGARERFLSDLVWGSKGLGGFNQGDLAEELDDDQ